MLRILDFYPECFYPKELLQNLEQVVISFNVKDCWIISKSGLGVWV